MRQKTQTRLKKTQQRTWSLLDNKDARNTTQATPKIVRRKSKGTIFHQDFSIDDDGDLESGAIFFLCISEKRVHFQIFKVNSKVSETYLAKLWAAMELVRGARRLHRGRVDRASTPLVGVQKSRTPSQPQTW